MQFLSYTDSMFIRVFFLTERIKALIKEYLLNEEKSVLSEPLHMPTYQNRIIFCETRFIDQVQRIQLLSSIQLGAGNEDLAAIVKVKDRRKRGNRRELEFLIRNGNNFFVRFHRTASIMYFFLV